MLLSLIPRARVGALIWHHVDPVPLSLVKLVKAFVASAVRVILHAEAIDFLIQPISSELAAICPFIRSESFDDIVLVIAGVRLIIRPFLNTIAISFVIDVISIKRTSIGPDLGTNTFLLALSELTFVPKMIDVK